MNGRRGERATAGKKVKRECRRVKGRGRVKSGVEGGKGCIQI